MIVYRLVTEFHELQNGQALSGRSTDRLAAAVIPTAKAVSVAHAAGIYAQNLIASPSMATPFNRVSGAATAG